MLLLRMFSALAAVAIFSVIRLPTASAQTKINIGIAAVSPRSVPLYIAQEQGLFAKHGIDARIVLI